MGHLRRLMDVQSSSARPQRATVTADALKPGLRARTGSGSTAAVTVWTVIVAAVIEAGCTVARKVAAYGKQARHCRFSNPTIMLREPLDDINVGTLGSISHSARPDAPETARA